MESHADASDGVTRAGPLLFITSSRGSEVERSWSNPKFKEVIRAWLNPGKMGEMERKLPRGQHTHTHTHTHSGNYRSSSVWIHIVFCGFSRLNPRHVTYSGPLEDSDPRPVFFGATIKKNISLWFVIILVFIQLLNCNCPPRTLAGGHGAGRGQFTSPTCNINRFLNFMLHRGTHDRH